MGFRASKEKKALEHEVGAMHDCEQRLFAALKDRGTEDIGDEAVRAEAKSLYDQIGRCLDLLMHYPSSKGGRAAREEIDELKATLAARRFTIGGSIGAIDGPDESEQWGDS